MHVTVGTTSIDIDTGLREIDIEIDAHGEREIDSTPGKSTGTLATSLT
jgi:hypothetical protein